MRLWISLFLISAAFGNTRVAHADALDHGRGGGKAPRATTQQPTSGHQGVAIIPSEATGERQSNSESQDLDSTWVKQLEERIAATESVFALGGVTKSGETDRTPALIDTNVNDLRAEQTTEKPVEKAD